jgi:hypothetical protein
MEIDMTREEAIKELRGFIGQLTEGCQEVIKVLVPELCESEDEEIRRAIVETIKQCPYDFLNPKNRDKMLAYLEKQKENPKTADSIPSDCASDAKCEDRWHKVGDSLPDNGRLVLANDCLGNILLARYDGEGNWEVSVYDNEDYYCRNTITKWCEIPSEKQKEPENTSASVMIPSCWEVEQKEQKPAEWSEEDDQLIGFIFDLLNDLVWRKDWAMSKEECLKRLKSLRPSWKPSEEQMRILNWAANGMVDKSIAAPEMRAVLRELYEQLKAL